MTTGSVVRLDRASPVPLYYQLAQNMETAIRSGRLSSGSHLDNEIELARQLRVSRPTVRRAIALLAIDGHGETMLGVELVAALGCVVSHCHVRSTSQNIG